MARLRLALAAGLMSVPTILAAEITPDGLTPISELLPYAHVRVGGQVTAITDEDEFVLEDVSGSVLIYIGDSPMPVQRGDAVTVVGLVDDDRTREIYATRMVLADGTEVAITGTLD